MPVTAVVVGAAIVRDGLVLAARRSRPRGLAGGWEFPGGKVEPDETEQAALARECTEELRVSVVVGELLGSSAINPSLQLRVYLAALADEEPQSGVDHDDLRWLSADQLHSVRWLPADRPIVAKLAAILRSSG